MNTTDRFEMPLPGPPSGIAFPAVTRSRLSNGLSVWTLPHSALPVVSFALVLDCGTSADPPGKHGLASLVGSLAAESAGPHDSIALADALMRIGGDLEVQPGADVTIVSLLTLARHAPAGLDLLADVVMRPQLNAADFDRVRDLRLSRLRQASRIAGTIADRALIAAVFADHPYSRGSLGTTRTVEGMTVDDARDFWTSGWSPAGATLIAVGDLTEAELLAEATRVFGKWTGNPSPAPPTRLPVMRRATDVIAVHRPGAAQAEVRVGHLAPPRYTPEYYGLITLNALLGGEFTSRINRNLRERRAITYGARSGFDLRRAGGVFSCDAAVQADSAAVALSEIQRELRDVAVSGAVAPDELEQARASLTRGYVRHFETAAHLARAAATLATYNLPADTYDKFVPRVLELTAADITGLAQTFLRPDDAALVVVADLDQYRGTLADQLGRPVTETTIEF